MSHNDSRHDKKKRKKLKIILISVLILLVACIGGGFYYINHILSKVETTKIDKEDLDINKDLENQLKAMGKDKITNIALLGLDKRDDSDPGRSDSTMILSIDMEHKKVKLISIMRDSYVNISGHGKDKLNHAYSFGGPELSIKTLNQNFNLNITDFVSVDFSHMQKIVDYLGGVTVDVKDTEVDLINKYILDVANLENISPDYLKHSGTQNLSGIQALAYSRIRYVGNGDFERTERQRRVLEALFNKISNTSLTEFPSLVSNLLPFVKTSLSSGDIIKIGSYALLNNVTNLEQERFPLDSDCVDGGEMIDGVWYLPFDKEATTTKLHKYIFEDIKPS